MRLLTFISLLIFGLGCAGTRNTASKRNQLNGSWTPVKQEIGGTSLPNAAFATQRLIIKDGTYTVIAESIDKGIVQYTGNKMDIFGKDGVNNGKHFTAIYKYENEQLSICYNLAGDSYPETFDTKGKRLLFLSVFQKEIKK
jgi:uncharacterized protein (TIGR03067 family)